MNKKIGVHDAANRLVQDGLSDLSVSTTYAALRSACIAKLLPCTKALGNARMLLDYAQVKQYWENRRSIAQETKARKAAEEGIRVNVELGFMEVVPGDPTRYRLTEAGENHVLEMMKRNDLKPPKS